MGNIEKQSDVLRFSKNLEQTKHLLTSAIDQISEAQGQKIDHVKELCDNAHIKKQTLAIAIIFECKGDISGAELAKRLNINERTLRKKNWRHVRELLVRQY